MACPLCIEFAGALYYVTSRGDGQEAIYLDGADREAFDEVLGEVCRRTGSREIRVPGEVQLSEWLSDRLFTRQIAWVALIRIRFWLAREI